MSMSPNQASALADLLPDGMSCTNARERLLCLVEILRRLTDADHTLSNADIRAVLRAYFGDACAPSENTIAADLRSIAASGCLDLALHVTPSGVWCERVRLTPHKVRLLLSALQSSRAITTEQSYDLQENLIDLVSCYQEDDLLAEVHVDQRQRIANPEVFVAIDVAARAIRLKRKIEFEYSYTDFAGKPRVLAGDNGQTLRCETPIALYYSEGNYYVETYSKEPWRHGIKLMRSRADRMINTRLSSMEADRGREVYNARRSVRRRLEQEFNMVDGPQRRIFLRVRSDSTNVIFDRFGYGIRYAQFEGQKGSPSETGLTFVVVNQSFTFFRWLSASGDGIVITEPPSELGLTSGPWARKLKGVSREDLMEDYQCMVDGFLAYLDRARAPYEQRS